MRERILIAGSGGQGIILVGKILATLAMRNVPHLTFFPSYGAEVRGGVSHCQIILSSDEIASPVSKRLDTLMIMNQASSDAFRSRLEPGGLLIINRSLCKVPDGGDVLAPPASEMANDLGEARSANFIMLGVYASRRPLVRPADAEAAIERTFGQKNRTALDVNLRAFRAGLGWKP